MAIQYISDISGTHTAVVVPIDEWNNMTAKRSDLKKLMKGKASQTKDASRFKGLLTPEEAEKYDKYLKQARSEWDRDI